MTRTDPELGTVRRCARCREEWPLDETFWYARKTPRKDRGPAGNEWYTYCRACENERGIARRIA